MISSMKTPHFLKRLVPPASYINWKVDRYQPLGFPPFWILIVFLLAALSISIDDLQVLIFPTLETAVIISSLLPILRQNVKWQEMLLVLFLAMACIEVAIAQVDMDRELYAFGVLSLMQMEVYRRLPYYSTKLIAFASQVSIRLAIRQQFNPYELTCWITQLILLIEYEKNARSIFHLNQSLLSLVNSFSNAVCIVKNHNQLLYSNAAYQKLAINLNNQLKGSMPDDNDSLVYAQIQLIKNLHFEELSLPRGSVARFQANTLDFDDNYRISKVSFGDEKELLHPQLYGSDTKLQTYVDSQYFHNQLFGNQIKQRKTFSSDVTVQLELDHQPSLYVQSAIKRKLRNSAQAHRIYKLSTSTNPQFLLDNPSGINIRRRRFMSSETPIYEARREPPVEKPPSLINQRVKLLVNQVESMPSDSNDQYRVYMVQDVTQALTKEKLEEIERVKRNLFRSISHDLVTYLNGAHGYLQEVRSCMQDHPYSPQLSKMIESSHKCMKLQIYKTYDISDFRDIINESFRLRVTGILLNDVVTECLDLFEDQLRNKKIELTLDMPKHTIYVMGDRQRLCQVFLNLMSNAIRFTEQGSIKVVIKSIPQTMADVRQHDPDPANLSIEMLLDKILEVRVTDSGIGLEQEKLGILAKKLQLLDEYERVCKDSVGIGMGLAVCKQILEQISPKEFNQLCVSSERGKGTEFSFYLQIMEHHFSPNVSYLPGDILSEELYPLNSKAEAAQVKVKTYNKSVKSSVVFPQIERKCECSEIMLVDDEDFNLQALQFLTKRYGFSSVLAYNGKEAVERVRDKMLNKCCSSCVIFRVIMMDINMPFMDGWQAVHRMREMAEEFMTVRIPIIAVTGFCSAQDKEKCFESGFDQVIIKPATKKIVTEMLDRFHVKHRTEQ